MDIAQLSANQKLQKKAYSGYLHQELGEGCDANFEKYEVEPEQVCTYDMFLYRTSECQKYSDWSDNSEI